jgi:hypothetical protein
MKGAFAIKSKKTPYQVCSEASSKKRVQLDLSQLPTWTLTNVFSCIPTAAQRARGGKEEGEQQQWQLFAWAAALHDAVTSRPPGTTPALSEGHAASASTQQNSSQVCCSRLAHLHSGTALVVCMHSLSCKLASALHMPLCSSYAPMNHTGQMLDT